MHAPAQKPGRQAPAREYLQKYSGAPDEVPTVAVFGGNSIVGRALELLLRGAGYEVRLLGQPEEGELGRLLEGTNLLILAPMLDSETRKEITNEIVANVSLAALPVLALVTSPAEHPHEGGRTQHVPWPCRTAELTQQIEAAIARTRTA
jgi:hypothetical protein